MDYKNSPIKFLILFLLLGTATPLCAESTGTKEELLQRIMEKAKLNEKTAENYGFYLDTNVKKLSAEGETKEEQARTFRMTWIDNHPYMELVGVFGKEPDAKRQKEERKRREKFVKELREENHGKEEKEEFTWEELSEKYDFEVLPADTSGRYVLSFQPKKGKLPERSQTEKLLNHLAGKIWADEQFNLLKAEAGLTEVVRYGLGILAKIDQLQLEYSQNPYENVWLPASLFIRVKAHVALLKTENREIRTHYYQYFQRPQEDSAASSSR